MKTTNKQEPVLPHSNKHTIPPKPIVEILKSHSLILYALKQRSPPKRTHTHTLKWLKTALRAKNAWVKKPSHFHRLLFLISMMRHNIYIFSLISSLFDRILPSRLILVDKQCNKQSLCPRSYTNYIFSEITSHIVTLLSFRYWLASLPIHQ